MYSFNEAKVPVRYSVLYVTKGNYRLIEALKTQGFVVEAAGEQAPDVLQNYDPEGQLHAGSFPEAYAWIFRKP